MKKKQKIIRGKKGGFRKLPITLISILFSILLLVTVIANVQSIEEISASETSVSETQTIEIQDEIDVADQPIEDETISEPSNDPITVLPIEEPVSDAAEIQDGTADAAIQPIEEGSVQEPPNDPLVVLPIEEPISEPIAEAPADDPSSGDSLTGGTPVELPAEEPVNEAEANGNEAGTIGNETGAINETENELGMLPEQNETTNETTLPGAMEGIIDILPQPNLDLQLYYPSKIIRGEAASIKAIITNFGTPIKNLQLQWILPDGFEIISGGLIENCGDLNAEESCTPIISIRTSASTSLGINQVKIAASYEQ